jgi:hypothetical protein
MLQLKWDKNWTVWAEQKKKGKLLPNEMKEVNVSRMDYKGQNIIIPSSSEIQPRG